MTAQSPRTLDWTEETPLLPGLTLSGQTLSDCDIDPSGDLGNFRAQLMSQTQIRQTYRGSTPLKTPQFLVINPAEYEVMYWKSFSAIVLSAGITCVPLLVDNDAEIRRSQHGPSTELRDFPSTDEDSAGEHRSLFDAILERTEALRDRALDLIDWSDGDKPSEPTQDQTRDVEPTNELPVTTVTRTPRTALRTRHDGRPSHMVDRINAPHSATDAYQRAMERARRAEALARTYASGAAAFDGQRNGVSVRITTGPQGRTNVVESVYGTGFSAPVSRSYSLSPTHRGHAVSVEATTDSTGQMQVRRYGKPIR
ncbi:hypothetical protein [Rhodopirellula sallentina]|uniref:Uncharacterized protein n=1 Tax=Rhodopirellula sallentina SM41 TaxID=1263870 RepID=M5UH30_9BACT|nr:hypothetical protein [Rhodopirellula sallentina]EMI55328.1 hypothetical protein RSSM_03234 [Rhodopirellula sallentina SM41]